jgi:hypothetical protein
MIDESNIKTRIIKPVNRNPVTKVDKPYDECRIDDKCRIIDLRSTGRIEEKPIAVKPNLQDRIINYINRIPNRYDGIIIYGIAALFYGSFLGLSYYDIREQEKSSMESHNYIFYDTAEVYGGRPIVNIEDKPILNVEGNKSNFDLLIESYTRLPQSRHFMMPGETKEGVCKDRLKEANSYNRQRLEVCIKVVEKNNKNKSRMLRFPKFK